jgi:hypothetical protein
MAIIAFERPRSTASAARLVEAQALLRALHGLGYAPDDIARAVSVPEFVVRRWIAGSLAPRPGEFGSLRRVTRMAARHD